MEITDTTEIAAPVAHVWALTLDVDGLPATTPTVSRVERLDDRPLDVGSRVRLWQPGLPVRTWTVEVCDDERTFAWATTLLGVRMVGVHELEALGPDRTRLTLRVLLEGRGAGLLGRIGGRSIARSLATENAGFARVAQRPAV